MPSTEEEKDSAATKKDCGLLGPKHQANAAQLTKGKRAKLPSGTLVTGNG